MKAWPPHSATASKFSTLMYALSALTSSISKPSRVSLTSGTNCGQSAIDLVGHRPNAVAYQVRLGTGAGFRALALGQVAAEVLQQHADAAFLRLLRDVVAGPVLFAADLLLREGHALGFDHRAVR